MYWTTLTVSTFTTYEANIALLDTCRGTKNYTNPSVQKFALDHFCNQVNVSTPKNH